MKISEFSVKNSMFINLLSIFFMIVGVIGVFTLNREVFPNISFDIVQITTAYPGATAEDIEKLITAPIERELKEVNDLKEIRSVSGDNFSNIYIKMEPDAKDKNKIVNEVQRAVDKIKTFPKNVEDPIVNEVDMRLIPIIEVAISGEKDEFRLQDYAESLENMLLNIPEVAKVRRRGWRDKEIWVEVDPVKLRDFYVSMEEIKLALAAQNVNLPAGVMRGKDTEYSIRTSGEFTTAEEVGNVIIRANDVGNWLRVKDVARVIDAFEEESEITRSFGTRTINLVVSKKERTDAIDLVARVKGTLEDFKKTVPSNIRVNTLNDISIYITRRLNVLKNNGFFGVLLVLIALLVFLSRRVAFFTALGIPIAFSITMGYMLFSGISINMITMFGLIIVLGMIVDDGIIISENVYRRIEEGVPPREAAVKGTEEVVPAVTTTVLTTIVAFLPMAFMSGIMGRFLKYIPIMVIVALLASLFEAFIILPSHLADFVKPRIDKKTKKIISKKEIPWFKKILDGYTRFIKSAIENRYRTMKRFIILLVVLAIIFKLFLKVVAFPKKGVEEFYLRAEASIGTSLDKTSALSRGLEKIIETLPDKELDGYVTTVGSISEGRTLDPYARLGSHLVQINAYLTPGSQRRREASEIIDSLRGKLKKVKGFEKVYFEQIEEGPPVGKAVDVRIKGDSYETLNEIASEYTAYLKSLEGVSDIDIDYKFGAEEISMNIDDEKAARAYLTAKGIAEGVRSAVGGGFATSIRRSKAEEEIDVLVRFSEKYRKDPSAFGEIVIPNKFGKLINLKDVATFDKSRKLESFKHIDGRRALRVTASVDEKKMTSRKANALLKRKFRDVEKEYPGYAAMYGGEEKDTQESFEDLAKALLIAFLVIFLILATKFNSLVQPVIILITAVFGIFGALLALLLHNMPFSFMAFMGMVGLIGVVVNDSIVLVDFINRLRIEGKERRESIIEAGRLRLRPVMLTTITTVFGLAPVVYGIGGADPFVQPAALALSWGLLFGTVITLIIVPCLYAIVDDATLRIAHHATVLKNKRKDQ